MHVCVFVYICWNAGLKSREIVIPVEADFSSHTRAKGSGEHT